MWDAPFRYWSLKKWMLESHDQFRLPDRSSCRNYSTFCLHHPTQVHRFQSIITKWLSMIFKLLCRNSRIYWEEQETRMVLLTTEWKLGRHWYVFYDFYPWWTIDKFYILQLDALYVAQIVNGTGNPQVSPARPVPVPAGTRTRTCG